MSITEYITPNIGKRSQKETVEQIAQLLQAGFSARQAAMSLGLQESSVRAYISVHRIGKPSLPTEEVALNSSVVADKSVPRKIDTVVLRLRPHLVEQLEGEAHRRGFSGSARLVQHMIKVICNDNLFNAVMDE